MMANDLVPQRKRLAMGQKLAGGGMVRTPTGAGAMVARPRGLPQSPLTTARHNNGIPGMCMGGKVKK